ncbi:stage V sporulation protein E [Fictibacillus macauensis ZFHKF-1]|uniref:Stage V sporulation protein E n=1 Tax=Fictibacillus macauensis ZFHKF-1 TaxID=1196324 RepID=I8AIU4_9BACL|nr:FtsW/RodA/SpoVE family cell cycle protein [Fictibacillus macauensis]EIT85677.1 stage V sporulation protein E [Fictibacillus macauensis ZFHKF-1]
MKVREGQWDRGYLLILLLLACCSIVSIYAAQETAQYVENFAAKQAFWYVFGIAISILLLLLDFQQIRRLSLYFYLFGNAVLLMLVLLPDVSFAPIRNGAQSWLIVPGFGSIQPSEFMKLILIVFLSVVASRHLEKYQESSLKESWLLVGKLLLTSGIPILLVLMQPDLGTALVMIGITFVMMLVAGVHWKIISGMLAMGVLFVGSFVFTYFQFPAFFHAHLLKEYQLGRIYAWLDPYGYRNGEGYNLVSSLIAVGSGEFSGKGLQQGDVYIAEAHSDFIFPIFAEQFGFIGSSVLITLFFLLIYKITSTALKVIEPFESFLCAGVIALFSIHIFENIGMTIGVVPITGIPLPFISYGGSALITNLLAAALIYNIRLRMGDYIFKPDH